MSGYICVNGHRSASCIHIEGNPRMCSVPGCQAEAEIDDDAGFAAVLSRARRESSEPRVTGGYEPNDPVVMSREEYRAALALARRESFVAGARWRHGKVRGWPIVEIEAQRIARLREEERPAP